MEIAEEKHVEGTLDCYELQRAKHRSYRTHPFFLDFYEEGGEENEITLVTQLSMNRYFATILELCFLLKISISYVPTYLVRLHMVESLCNQWHGPLSLALYLSDGEADQLVKFVQSSPILNKRKNVRYCFRNVISEKRS